MMLTSAATRKRKPISEGNTWVREKSLRVVTVLRFLGFVVVLYFFLDWLQLDGTDRDNFEVTAALRTGNDFTFVNLFFIDVEIGLAFRTIDHDGLRAKPELLTPDQDKSAPVNI
jgi:hypothetical protein